jgi:hypothetical protein
MTAVAPRPGGNPIGDLRFWKQVLEDQRRTVVCAPGVADRVAQLLDQHGVAGMFDIVASPHVDEHKLLMFDHHGIEAEQRAAIQRIGRAA